MLYTIFLVLFLNAFQCIYAREKYVNIPGFKTIQCTGDRTLACRHVPYAEYPFRFETAKPLQPFMNYTFDYYLTVDIFTKKLNDEKPVIVGLLQENLGEFDHVDIPRVMLKKVVFVYLRYRSGLYGFLSTNTEELRGNEALFDIIVALKWIKEYIFYFGGNPEKVTLMGLEDSGALVHSLAISPNTPKGLFHNIIVGETTAFTPRLVTNEPLTFAFQAALTAGCSPLDTVKDLNDCLKDPNINLGKMSRTCLFKERKRTNFSPIKLSVDDGGKLLPEHPLQLARSSIRHYPALLGTSRNVLKKTFDDLISEDDFQNFIPHSERIIDDAIILIRKFADSNSEEKWIDYVQFQVSNMTGHYSNRTIYTTILQDLIGILDSKQPLLEAAKYNSPTFLYAFNYDFLTLNSNQLGFINLESYQEGSLEERTFKTLIKIWTTFANTGEPPVKINHLYEKWPAVENFSYPYLRLSQYSYMGRNFEYEFQQIKPDDVDSEEDEDF